MSTRTATYSMRHDGPDQIFQGVLAEAKELNLPQEVRSLIDRAYRAGLRTGYTAENTTMTVETSTRTTADTLTDGTCFIGITPNGVPNEYIIYRNALGRTRLVNPDSGASKYDPAEITVDTIYAQGRFDTIGTKLTPTGDAHA